MRSLVAALLAVLALSTANRAVAAPSGAPASEVAEVNQCLGGPQQKSYLGPCIESVGETFEVASCFGHGHCETPRLVCTVISNSQVDGQCVQQLDCRWTE